MSDKQRRKIIIISYSTIFALGLLYYIFIQITGVSIPCRLYEMTGKMCGGCGTTRMMLNLAKFDVPKAFSYNPVMFIIFALWHIELIIAYIGKPKFMCTHPFITAMAIVTLITILIYTILRIFC